jgi:hypothetical protein
MSMGLSFGSGTKQQIGGLYNVKEITPIRHESSFMKVGNRASNIGQFMGGPSKVVENKSSFVDSTKFNVLDDLGKLDELIGGF